MKNERVVLQNGVKRLDKYAKHKAIGRKKGAANGHGKNSLGEVVYIFI